MYYFIEYFKTNLEKIVVYKQLVLFRKSQHTIFILLNEVVFLILDYNIFWSS